jgi:hypothetical protein
MRRRQPVGGARRILRIFGDLTLPLAAGGLDEARRRATPKCAGQHRAARPDLLRGKSGAIEMATAAAPQDDRSSISIGRILSRAFGTLGSNPVATLGIALLFSALPSMLIIYAIASWGIEPFRVLGPTATIAVAIFSLLVFILLSMITQGALVRATVAYSQGGKASLAESAMAGLTVMLPLFLLGLLSALGFLLGLILLVVPGVILYVMCRSPRPRWSKRGSGRSRRSAAATI